MRLVIVLLAALGVWFLLRHRGGDDRRVIVAWEDGSELHLRDGSVERERLEAVAREVVT